MSILDSGLASGNYFDYPDDEVAAQREYEIMESLPGHYLDPSFPPDARSLYFDPFHPPRGASPGNSFIWCRISKGEVLQCDAPIYCNRNAQSSQIIQGALGNSYFVNSLRLLSSQTNCKQLMRLLVSEKYAAQGMYTFKFFKAGRWRYVHIDDLIPCRQSGRVNFSRNYSPNETFAMLVEKAYAKLNGCYEAIVNGLIEKVIADLTPGGHTRCFRNERQDLNSVCDSAWTFIEKGLVGEHTLGCGKFLPDPYCEKLADRQGVSVGVVYQIMDAFICTNPPTAELDSLTVGMICVRNLQADEGRFIGRWSYGHLLWQQYKDIGIKLRHRTRELQFKRGLGLDPNATDPETGALINFVTNDVKSLKIFKEEEKVVKMISERDGLNTDYIGRTRFPPPQPEEKDLYWIQIEDFVDLFNRIYSSADCSIPPPSALQYKAGFKKYVSKWIPGDFLCGSGGPPMLLKPPKIPVLPNPAEPEIDSIIKDFNDAVEQDRKDEEAQLVNAATSSTLASFAEPSHNNQETPPRDSENGGIGEEKESGVVITRTSFVDQKGASDEKMQDMHDSSVGNMTDSKTISNEFLAATESDGAKAIGSNLEGSMSTIEAEGKDAVMSAATATQGISRSDYAPIIIAATPISAIYDDEDDAEAEQKVEEEEMWDPIQINEDFTDNPMYPFSVTEPTQICITLYQPDRRWSVGRLGEDPRNIVANEFASRSERLASCMRYNQSIGFLVVRMFGLKVRVTDFKLRKIRGGSDDICYSNIASACVVLRPGRYAIIPFTDQVVGSAQDYVLYCNFNANQVEFEFNDLLVEKPMDNDISDDESGDEEEEEDEDDDEDKSPDAVAAREEARELKRRTRLKAKFDALEYKPPELAVVPDWEFVEDSENMATISVFDEVCAIFLQCIE